MRYKLGAEWKRRSERKFIVYLLVSQIHRRRVRMCTFKRLNLPFNFRNHWRGAYTTVAHTPTTWTYCRRRGRCWWIYQIVFSLGGLVVCDTNEYAYVWIWVTHIFSVLLCVVVCFVWYSHAPLRTSIVTYDDFVFSPLEPNSISFHSLILHCIRPNWIDEKNRWM